MVKSMDKKVKVVSGSGGSPRSFYWNGEWVNINRIHELWKDTGAWWNGESEKTFYRVETTGGSLYELYLDDIKQNWFLYRIYD